MSTRAHDLTPLDEPDAPPAPRPRRRIPRAAIAAAAALVAAAAAYHFLWPASGPAPFDVKVREAEASLKNAQAKVVGDRADTRLKKLLLERNRTLLARNLVAQNDLDTAETANEQASAQLALDQAGVAQAEAS